LRYLRALRRYLVDRGDRLTPERLAVERAITGLHRERVVSGVRRRWRKLVRA
jgi:hypothetical protein